MDTHHLTATPRAAGTARSPCRLPLSGSRSTGSATSSSETRTATKTAWRSPSWMRCRGPLKVLDLDGNPQPWHARLPRTSGVVCQAERAAPTALLVRTSVEAAQPWWLNQKHALDPPKAGFGDLRRRGSSGSGSPAIQVRFSRFRGTVQQGPVQRQEWQIVQP